MSRKIVSELYEKHIKGTDKEAIVADKKIFLCHLTGAVVKGIALETRNSYITTRALKHLYDKKPAEEFMFIVENLHKIVKYPDRVYKNKSGKKGEFCFVKHLKGSAYLCSVQIVKETVNEQELLEAHIVTCFRIQKISYLQGYELLWSWKDGTPSS